MTYMFPTNTRQLQFILSAASIHWIKQNCCLFYFTCVDPCTVNIHHWAKPSPFVLPHLRNSGPCATCPGLAYFLTVTIRHWAQTCDTWCCLTCRAARDDSAHSGVMNYLGPLVLFCFVLKSIATQSLVFCYRKHIGHLHGPLDRASPLKVGGSIPALVIASTCFAAWP